jgi:hypothetical protein
VAVRHKKFGDMAGSPSTTPLGDSAGTVASFTPASGTTPASLTIKLNNGTLVTAAFTDATKLECQTAKPADNEGTEGTEPKDNDATESSQTNHDEGDHTGGGDNQGGGGDENGQGDDEHGGQGASCTTANLTPGTVVTGAEIKISNTGEAWEKVELSV